MKFLVLDFETACHDKSSICQAGLVEYNNGKIDVLIDEYINPQCEFDMDSPWFNKLHGISAIDVKDALSFEEFYPKLKALIENKIVFNYNGSDEQFLKSACEKYNLEFINVKWLDPLSRIQNTWKGLKKHKLEIIADYLGIDYSAHNAAQDSIATAKVIAVTSIVNDYSVEDWGGKLVDALSLKNIRNSNTVNTKTTSSLIDENYIPPKSLVGEFIVITLFDDANKDFLKHLVEMNNGIVQNGQPNGKTTLIIAGNGWPEAAKGKSEKAKNLGIDVITKQEFLEKVKLT